MNIKDLPKELRELAILRRKQHLEKYGEGPYRSQNMVLDMFEWGSTPENDLPLENDFWTEIHESKNLEKHNEYAKSIVGNLSSIYEIY